MADLIVIRTAVESATRGDTVDEEVAVPVVTPVKVNGLTFIASDRIFAVDKLGKVASESVPLGMYSSPVCIGNVNQPTGRVYVLDDKEVVYMFKAASLSSPPISFKVAAPTLWSLAHGGSTLFVGTGTPPTYSQSGIVAIDDMSGIVKWRRSFADAVLSPASLVYDDAAVVRLIFCSGTQMYALDPGTGAIIWKEPGAANDQVVVGHNLYYSDSMDGSVTARSAMNGILLWKHISPKKINSHLPAVAGGVVYVTTEDFLAIALDAHTGKPIWQRALNERPGNPAVYLPPGADVGIVIFAVGEYSGGSSHLIGISTHGGGSLWSSSTVLSGEGRGSTTPIIGFSNIVQVGTSDGRLVSINPLTGDLIWGEKLGPGEFFSPASWMPF